MEKENIDGLLEIINREGFLLEERTAEIIRKADKSKIRIEKIFPRQVFETPNYGPVEIDIYAISGYMQLVIECKKTRSVWLFAKKKNRSDFLYLLKECLTGYEVNKIKFDSTNLNISSYNYSFGCIFKNGKFVNTSGEINPFKQIQEAIFQSLKQVQTIIQRDPSNRLKEKIVLPLIVTNTDLYGMEFDENMMNSDGDLEELSIKDNLPFVALEFASELKWDINGCQVVRNDDVNNTITVFIVNIKHLSEFLYAINQIAEGV